MVNGEDVKKYLLSVDSGESVGLKNAEIWSEFDGLGLPNATETIENKNVFPKPEDLQMVRDQQFCRSKSAAPRYRNCFYRGRT